MISTRMPPMASEPMTRTAEQPAAAPAAVQVSVVMPCLNERDTIGPCITRALEALAALGLPGEVVVADNGSNDGSVEIAQALGARVVHQAGRG